MMTDLPHFDDSSTYLLTGETLNLLSRAIESRTPLAGDGLLATPMPQGVLLRVAPGRRGSGAEEDSSSSSSDSSSSSSSSGSGSPSDSGSPKLPDPGFGSSSSGSGSPSDSGSSDPPDSGSSPGSPAPSGSLPSGGSGGSPGPSGGSGPGNPPGSGSGSPGGGSGGSGGGSGSPGPGASKSAIVPVEIRPGSTEWIGWFCVERDVTVFEIVRDVPLNADGQGRVKLEPELILSCEIGSLRVVSAMAVGAPGMATANIEKQSNRPGCDCLLLAAAHWLGKRAPHTVRVRVEGVRRGHTEQWPRYTEAQAASNNAFWGCAPHIVIQ